MNGSILRIGWGSGVWKEMFRRRVSFKKDENEANVGSCILPTPIMTPGTKLVKEGRDASNFDLAFLSSNLQPHSSLEDPEHLVLFTVGESSALQSLEPSTV